MGRFQASSLSYARYASSSVFHNGPALLPQHKHYSPITLLIFRALYISSDPACLVTAMRGCRQHTINLKWTSGGCPAQMHCWPAQKFYNFGHKKILQNTSIWAVDCAVRHTPISKTCSHVHVFENSPNFNSNQGV